MQVWIAIAVGMAAVIDDLARRHIANWIPAAALAGGLGWQIGRGGWPGALTALAGTAAGFAVFLIFYLLGGMGGGDIKLMAGFGALLGAERLFEAALWTAGIGGIMALAVLGWRALRHPKTTPEIRGVEEQEREASIPYAPAIALGVWLSLVAKT
jgi:prepilin peptidase CpaA